MAEKMCDQAAVRVPTRAEGEAKTPQRKLTARFVESVKTDKAQDEHRDTQEQGPELRVTRAGTKSWAFRCRRNSDRKKRVIALGRFPGFRSR